MTATATLPFNTSAGRIQNAATGKPGVEALGAGEGGQESFATVLAGTVQTTEAAAAGVAPAATGTASASTQISKLFADATGEVETIPAEVIAEGVVADPSQTVPAAATQAAIVTAVTTAAPNLTGTAVVADAEPGDTAIPVEGDVEDAVLAPGVAPAIATPAAVVAGAPTPAANAAATSIEAAAAGPAPEGAVKVELDPTTETLDIAEGDGAETVASASSQKPAKASASTTVASPAGATNSNVAAAAVTAAAPDLQAAAIDPAAGQARAAAPVDALTAPAPASHETARAASANTAGQAAAPATVQVYTRMIERFDGRAQRFEIRLDPAELGRVDVRIEIGADKKVHAVLAAHDSAALNDLMRGHRALERALADAGIDLADGGVKFELANDSNRNASTSDRDARTPTSPNVWRNFDITNPSAEAAAKPLAQPWRQTRLDLVA